MFQEMRCDRTLYGCLINERVRYCFSFISRSTLFNRSSSNLLLYSLHDCMFFSKLHSFRPTTFTVNNSRPLLATSHYCNNYTTEQLRFICLALRVPENNGGCIHHYPKLSYNSVLTTLIYQTTCQPGPYTFPTLIYI